MKKTFFTAALLSCVSALSLNLTATALNPPLHAGADFACEKTIVYDSATHTATARADTVTCADTFTCSENAEEQTNALIAEIFSVANGIINRKKKDVGSDENGFLINDRFLTLAGTTPGDWYPIGLGRLNVTDNAEGYLAVINDVISKRYSRPEKLDKAKATEWHRISLSITACGGNPLKCGNDGEINLIADGTYNRTDENGNGILGKQGINGFIWGLISLDSMSYPVPEGARYTRDDIILNILSREINGGGWALSGNEPDPDITAMAIQSLAPYYNSEKEYVYKRSGAEIKVKARDCVKRAFKVLSLMQQSDGGFISWGTPNSESAVQVLTALCSCGKNPLETSEFIKDGKTVYDGILKYRNADGGFLHSFVYDEDNPTSLPTESNTMAGEQALYGTAAFIRFLKSERRLYDFRPEQSEFVKNQIKNASFQIENLTVGSPLSEIERVYDDYLKIDYLERSYVFNYEKLSDILKFRNIPYAEEPLDYGGGNDDTDGPMFEFTQTDMQKTDALPRKLSMANKPEVLKLFAKIRNSFDFENKNVYYAKLEKAKNEIDSLEKEIENIKNEIKSELYPFESVSLSKKKAVYDLYNRFIALSEYDKSLFEKSDAEGLLKAKTQVDNLQTALIISAVAAVLAAAITLIIILRVKKRKKLKALSKMPESDE